MRARTKAGRVWLLATLLWGTTVAVTVGPHPAGAQEQPATSVVVLAGVPGEQVDVAIDGDVEATGLGFRERSEALVVEAGRHEVLLRPTGGIDESPVETTVDIEEGQRVTVARYLDATGEAGVASFVDDLSPVPAGQGRLVVRHLASLPDADVRVNREVAVEGLSSGGEAVREVPAGTARIDVVLAGGNDPLLDPAELDIPEGATTIVSVVGSARDDDVDVVVERVGVEEPAPEPAPAAPRQVTVVQALLGTELDLWVDDEPALQGLAATRLASGLELPAGPHTFAFRLAGDDEATAPVAQREVDVSPEAGAVVVHLDEGGDPTVTAFPDPAAGTGAPGQARITLRNVAVGGAVDVRVGDQELAADLEPGREASAVVPAGAATVAVRFDGGPAIDPVALQLEEGSTSVLYVAGSSDDGSATVLRETAGQQEPAPRTVPTGTPGAAEAGVPLLVLATLIAMTAPRAAARLRTVRSRP
jgi:hypothetical protein